MGKRMTRKEFKKGLKQFRRPTQDYWNHYANGYLLRLSEGCHFVRDVASFWLIEKIACVQNDERFVKNTFQIWQLKRCFYDWHLECINGDWEVLHSVNIDLIYFPVDEFTIIVYDGVAMLEAEYRAQYFKS